MIKAALSLILLALSTIPALGQASQMNQVYIQTQEGPNNNNYPRMILPGARTKHWAQPIYDSNPIASYVNTDGANTTFALASGTTANLAIGDGIKMRNVSGQSDTVCRVTGVPDSTHFVMAAYYCNSPPYYMNTVGSGNLGGSAYYWKLDGPGMNSHGTWEIIDQGSTAGKYFLRQNDLTTQSTSIGSSCTPDLHTSTCYIAHPTLTNALPRDVYIEVDPSLLPVCSFTGSIQAHNLVLSSTVKFTVRFTPNQNTGFHGDQLYYACAVGAGSGKKAVVHIVDGYAQNYKNTEEPIFVREFGNSDQYNNVSLASDDGLGDATIETFAAPAGEGFLKNGGKKPLFIFHPGTVTDGYTITVTSDVDPTASYTIRRYVSAQTKPAANADKVYQRPCDIDPVMTAAGGTVYNIGPGQTYADMADPSLPTWNFPWGSIFRLHGETATPGAGGLAFHNYVEFKPPNNAASFATNYTVPAYYICGIPVASTGEQPWLDGQNATSSVNIGHFTGDGNLLTLNGIGTANPNFDTYQGTINLTHHVGVAGINLRRNWGNQGAGTGYQHFPPGVTTGPEVYWGNGSAIRSFSINNYALTGIFFNDVANGTLTDCNAQAGWWKNCSADIKIFGNHFAAYGLVGASTEHATYCQDWGCVMAGNLEDGSKSDQATGAFSMRGFKAWYMFNRVVAQPGLFTTNGFGGNSENQDASYYLDIDGAIGPTPGWDTQCSDGTQNYPFLCTPSTGGTPAIGGMNTIAAFQSEHDDSMFMISNAMGANPGANGGCSMSISNSHRDVNGLENQRTLYYWNNIVDCPNAEFGGDGAEFEDWRPADGQNRFDTQPVIYPSAEWGNNIYWWFDNTATSGFRTGFGNRITGKAIWTGPNIWHPNQYNPTQTNIPIAYGNDGFNAIPYGITQASQQDMPSASFPVEAKMGNWSNTALYFTPSSKPYNTTTLAATGGSVAVGTAVPPNYPSSLYPAIYNAVDATGALTRRTQVDSNSFPTTMGAYDTPGGGPTPVSIAMLPNPLTASVSTSGSLICTTTLSNSATRACISPACTSTNVASMTISGVNWTATATPGTGTLNCLAESLTAPGDVFTVTAPTLVSMLVTPDPGSVGVGGTLAMTCITTLSDGTHPLCSAVGTPVWSSTVMGVATVDSSGVVTGVSGGSTLISVTMLAVTSNSATVNVSSAPSSIQINGQFQINGKVTVLIP